MSTKTTFKRVALATVAALGFGLLASAPTSAAPQADTLAISAAASTTAPGTAATVTVTQTYLSTATSDAVTATAYVSSMPAGNSSLPTWSTISTATDAGSPVKSVVGGLTAQTTGVAASTFATANFTLSFNTQTAGTYVFRILPHSGATAASLTWTVTVADAATGPTAAASGVFMQAGAPTAQGFNYCGNASSLIRLNQCAIKVTTDNNLGVYTNSTLGVALAANIAAQKADTVNNVSTLSVAGGTATAGNVVANVGVTISNSTTASTITGASQSPAAGYIPAAGVYYNASKFPVTATISGPGWIKYADAIRGKTYTEATGDVDYLQKTFLILSDGSLGTATITYTAGGVTLATHTVHFVGAAVSITPTVAKSVIGAVATSAVVTGVVKDANGLPVSGTNVFAVSSDKTVISNSYTACGASSATGAVSCDLTGVAAGTSNITLTTNTSSTVTTGISSAASAVRVGSTSAVKAVVAWDNTEYLPGQAAKLTVTLTDASGLSVVDGSYTVFGAAATSNFALSAGSLPSTGATVTTVAGVATYSVNMPMTAADIVVTVTAITGGTIAVTAPATVSVVDKASAIAQSSQDAAAEATDAANAATDAANAAAEAADAATAAAQDAADAVAALSTQVAEMIDSLKKQITALTNLVIKIQKKVKA
jgi:hypothetical protein